MNKKRILGLTLVTSLTVGSMTGCVKPYQKPILEEIATNESAFLVPLVGDGTEQSAFSSEEMLKENMVATKRVEIPTTWVQLGRRSWKGEWMPSAKLIKVDRTPITREWTESQGDGTSNSNQGIKAESIESISFMARMSCTASIEEANAPKFLYYYNTKSLAEVMDTEIRTLVESTFNELCAKYTLNEILANKQEIMNIIRDTVTTTFSKKGITISNIGYKGEFSYDSKIQESINAKFTAEKEAEAQAIKNQQDIDKAQAEAEAIRIQSSTLSEQIKLKEAEAKVIEAEARLQHGWVEVQGAASVITATRN